MTEPQFQQFGLSQKDAERIQGLVSLIDSNESGVQWMERLLPSNPGCLGELIGAALFITVLWPFFLLGLLLTPVINVALRIKLHYDPQRRNYQNYQDAVLRFKRKQHEFWFDLSPLEFERQVAGLYTRLGYHTTVTPGSGDGGIDIVMYNAAEKIIVQCKRHRNPIGPAVVRELYGSLSASNAQSAILICTGGFTKGVYQFARDKPISLLDIDGILDLEHHAVQGSMRRSTGDIPRRISINVEKRLP
ncbi:MAG: DUF2034 domain-containing protein [Phycisphaerae bacterium]